MEIFDEIAQLFGDKSTTSFFHGTEERPSGATRRLRAFITGAPRQRHESTLKNQQEYWQSRRSAAAAATRRRVQLPDYHAALLGVCLVVIELSFALQLNAEGRVRPSWLPFDSLSPLSASRALFGVACLGAC